MKAVPGKGFGLFAGQDIKKGSFLCLYAGEVISTKEARERWRDQLEQGRDNYILVIKEVTSRGDRQEVLKTTVDPTRIGNVGRFMSEQRRAECVSLVNMHELKKSFRSHTQTTPVPLRRLTLCSPSDPQEVFSLYLPFSPCAIS